MSNKNMEVAILPKKIVIQEIRGMTLAIKPDLKLWLHTIQKLL